MRRFLAARVFTFFYLLAWSFLLVSASHPAAQVQHRRQLPVPAPPRPQPPPSPSASPSSAAAPAPAPPRPTPSSRSSSAAPPPTPTLTSTSSSSSSATPTSITPTTTSTTSTTPTSTSTPIIIPTTTRLTTAPFTLATGPAFRPTQVVTSTEDLEPTDLPPEETNPSAATGQGFWTNKGAVAGTFSVVGLIGVGLLFAAITYGLRRRSEKLAAQEDYFEKYPEDSNHHGNADDAISIHDVTTQAPVDAYPDRQIHFGTQQLAPAHMYPSQQHYAQDTQAQQYAPGQFTQYEQQPQHAAPHQGAYIQQGQELGYPPGTAYAQYMDTQYQYDTQAAYDADDPSAVANHQNFAPANHQSGSTPPVAFRDAHGRESYQQSIDSFYGASGNR